MTELKRHAQLGTILIVLLAYGHFAIGEKLASSLLIMFYILEIAIAVALLVWLLRLIRDALTDWQLKAASAKQAEVMVITAGRDEQLVIRDPDTSSYYRQLHLSPSSHVNGVYQPPSAEQLAVYNSFHQPRGSASGRPQAELVIDQPESHSREDVLSRYNGAWIVGSVLSAYHLHICGVTGSGKTTLANAYLGHRLKLDPAAKICLINPKQIPGKKPFIVEPLCKSIDDVMDYLNHFHTLMVRRQQGLDPIDHPIICVIDEWDWVFDTYGQDAVRLARALIKVGRELGLSVVLIGQSPLSQDTGLNGSVFDNMVRIGIMTAGEKLLSALTLGRDELKPLRAQFTDLRALNTGKPTDSPDLVRYCLVTVMGGNPSVEVIPNISRPEPATLPAPALALPEMVAAVAAPPPKPRPNDDEIEIFRAWFDMDKSQRSWNKLWKITTGKSTNVATSKVAQYKSMFDKYEVPYAS